MKFDKSLKDLSWQESSPMEFVYLMLNLLTIGLKVKQLIKVLLEWFYGHSPTNPLNLAPFPTSQIFNGDLKEQTKNIKKIHEQVHDCTIKQNKKNTELLPTNTASLQLLKRRFSLGSSPKRTLS